MYKDMHTRYRNDTSLGMITAARRLMLQVASLDFVSIAIAIIRNVSSRESLEYHECKHVMLAL